ncbi:hypothetical protein QUF72_21765 [Desulfobacterales bacterium HSG2]|nr:hypothetical protein [Desulfobacterales bacterium HSG2]
MNYPPKLSNTDRMDGIALTDVIPGRVAGPSEHILVRARTGPAILTPESIL